VTYISKGIRFSGFYIYSIKSETFVENAGSTISACLSLEIAAPKSVDSYLIELPERVLSPQVSGSTINPIC